MDKNEVIINGISYPATLCLNKYKDFQHELIHQPCRLKDQKE